MGGGSEGQLGLQPTQLRRGVCFSGEDGEEITGVAGDQFTDEVAAKRGTLGNRETHRERGRVNWASEDE